MQDLKKFLHRIPRRKQTSFLGSHLSKNASFWDIGSFLSKFGLPHVF